MARHLSFVLESEAGPGPALERIARSVIQPRPWGSVARLRLPSADMSRACGTFRPCRARSRSRRRRAPGCWLRGDDRGDLVHRDVDRGLAGSAFRSTQSLTRFCTGRARPHGLPDGTENPTGAKAVRSGVARRPGSRRLSFVAVQQWVHDFKAFDLLGPDEQDMNVGRRRSDNERSRTRRRRLTSSARPRRVSHRDVLAAPAPWAEGHAGRLCSSRSVTVGREAQPRE
jgi:hypothetical protein